MKKIFVGELFLLAVIGIGLLCVVVSFPVVGLAAFGCALFSWFVLSVFAFILWDKYQE